MNFKTTLLALSIFTTSCSINLNAQTEPTTTLKDLVIAPYNKETDEQGLHSFLTTWFKRSQNFSNQADLNEFVDYTINHKIGHDPDPTVPITTHLISQKNTIHALMNIANKEMEIIYFDSILDAAGNCLVVSQIVQAFNQHPDITKIVWIDFNGADTEKKQKDIEALMRHGFTKGLTTLPFSSITLDTCELVQIINTPN